jgi:hypothetical protein
MTLRTAFAAAAFAALAASATSGATAQTIAAAQYRGVKLGPVSGDVYYTVRPDGYHVTATFAAHGDAATPVRFEAVLAPHQSVTISTPRGAGEPADSVEISRVLDRVLVHEATPVD